MIAEAVPLLDTSPYTAQYERLRSQVIGARSEAPRPNALGQPGGVGLALLLREGMPGWLKAIEAVIGASVRRRTCEAADSTLPLHPAGSATAPAWLFGVPRHDLTALLTSLVLSTRPVPTASSKEGYRSCP